MNGAAIGMIQGTIRRVPERTQKGLHRALSASLAAAVGSSLRRAVGPRAAVGAIRRTRTSASGSALPGNYGLSALPLYCLEKFFEFLAEGLKGQEARYEQEGPSALERSLFGDVGL